MDLYPSSAWCEKCLGCLPQTMPMYQLYLYNLHLHVANNLPPGQQRLQQPTVKKENSSLPPQHSSLVLVLRVRDFFFMHARKGCSNHFLPTRTRTTTTTGATTGATTTWMHTTRNHCCGWIVRPSLGLVVAIYHCTKHIRTLPVLSL